MNQTYKRGDIYFADLGQGVGSEQMGYRPVVIIQNDVGNKHSPTVIVAAITSKVDARAKQPTHCFIGTDYGLELPSVVLCLCKPCADNFRIDGKYDLVRISENEERDTCTYCNHRMGYEYVLLPKAEKH